MTHTPNRTSSCRPAASGFTIVELIVVLGIVALLMGLLLPALASMRAASRQTAEAASARQLFIAYTNYSTVWDDAVLPGYRTSWSDGRPLRARDASGIDLSSQGVPGVAIARYPWRLAPYLDFQFDSLYLNDQGESLDGMRNTTDGSFNYVVSLFPSLGLNARWVGGHEGQLAWQPVAIETFGRFWIERMSAVRRADQLIVFASARGADPAFPEAGVVDGYFDVRSPSFVEEEWNGDWHPNAAPGDHGFVALRHSDAAITALMDGSVELMTEGELRDMRHWANDATSEDWTMSPLSGD